MNQWQFEFFHVRIVCAGPSKRWDALQFTYDRFLFHGKFLEAVPREAMMPYVASCYMAALVGFENMEKWSCFLEV